MSSFKAPFTRWDQNNGGSVTLINETFDPFDPFDLYDLVMHFRSILLVRSHVQVQVALCEWPSAVNSIMN